MNPYYNATIWKFDLSFDPAVGVMMPRGAQVLCVQIQDDEPKIWALVDPQLEQESRFFDVYGTGHKINKAPGKYVGTIQIAVGLVFHVFERRK